MLKPAYMFLAVCLLAASCTCGEPTQDKQTIDGSTQADPQRTAVIIFFEGNVRVKRSGSLEWMPAESNMELATADKLRTLRNSFVNIEFERGGVLKVGPESLVVVTDLRVEPKNKSRRYTFTLVEGNVEAELDGLKKAGSEFKIRTSSAEASVLRREVIFQ